MILELEFRFVHHHERNLKITKIFIYIYNPFFFAFFMDLCKFDLGVKIGTWGQFQLFKLFLLFLGFFNDDGQGRV